MISPSSMLGFVLCQKKTSELFREMGESLDVHELAKALVTGDPTHIDEFEITGSPNDDGETFKASL